MIRGLGRFLYDFVIGDDWRIAAGVVLVLTAGAVLVATEAVPRADVPPLVGAGIVAVVGVSLLRR